MPLSLPLTPSRYGAACSALRLDQPLRVQIHRAGVVSCGRVRSMRSDLAGGDLLCVDADLFGRVWVRPGSARQCEGLDGRCACAGEGGAC